MKYYWIKIMAALFVMGSPGVGFLAGTAYGKWFGWLNFILAVLIGISLHSIANKKRRA